MQPFDFNIEIIHSLKDLNAKQWNALITQDNPFLKYEFLIALENNDCLGDKTGWYPHYFLAKDNNKQLIAAIPAYLKTNSFGEFVFDWAWASAYEKAGLEYYPKLLVGIPFTPVTGQRILVHPDFKHADIGQLLCQTIQQFSEQNKLSSIHYLFTNKQDTGLLLKNNLMPRLGYQYHWSNKNYQDFEDYLSHFKSRKRKKVKHERQQAIKENIDTVIKHGDELTDAEWEIAHTFYATTFMKKGNYPALTLGFFQEISKTMGKNIVVIFAQQQSKNIAVAINFRDNKALYGRYWGCNIELPCLHFEVCFYQGIEYCIKHKLQTFEPGAQGEHKITRGFLPTETWSMHSLNDTQFQSAVADFLNRETHGMQNYKTELDAMSPFKTIDL